MAQFTNFWRIITPVSRKTSYQQQTLKMDDSYNLNTAGYAAFANVSWYSNLLRGATARMQRYKQYDAMDSGDISRALDVIAEEMTNADKNTDLEFIIDYQTEENEKITDSTITTLRASLRYWCDFHSFNTRLYNIARTMVKYGDCFFRKISDTKKWEYIDPTRIVGIEIDPFTNEKIAYHIRDAGYKQGITRTDTATSADIVPASAIIHFTLSDDMGESAPFGVSILQPAWRDYQKLSMLEDSAIIYRIVRAPERRVFYIDVGNMPPQRIKQYIEQIRNDIRQKRVPNTTNMNQTDSQYNPECLALDTLIPLIDGRICTLQELINEYERGKVNWAHSCNPDTGEWAPGLITWAGITRKNTNVLKCTLNTGGTFICTPDHKIPIKGKGFVEAKDIKCFKDEVFAFNGNQFNFFNDHHINDTYTIIKIESGGQIDTGTLTIDGKEQFHNFHTFAIQAASTKSFDMQNIFHNCFFVKNSIQEDYFFPVTATGRGSRIETIPGGATWEIPELDYFLAKVFRALRVPTSYMKGQDAAGAQYTDGKVGIAYIEELRFANFIIRLQNCIDTIIDEQFKTYLSVAGINIEPSIFKLKLPDPQNFALYRQAALDSDLINSFKSIEDTKYLSKRFMLKRYLGLSEDDIKMNEILLKQERNIQTKENNEKDDSVEDIQQLYDPAVYENRQAISIDEPQSEESLPQESDELALDDKAQEPLPQPEEDISPEKQEKAT